MSKDILNEIRQMVKYSETEIRSIEQQRTCEEEKVETQKREESCFNLERLKKTGVVDLFNEIKKNGINDEKFIIEYLKNNTEIRLHWDKDNNDNESDNNGKRYITAKINCKNQLTLRKIIEESDCYYHGKETFIEDNLPEVISRILLENKNSQTQTSKRSFLDRLLGK